MPEERMGPQVAYRAVLLAGALLVLGLLFRQLVTLLLAALITTIIAIPLAAAATRLERRGVPRPIGALLALLAGLAVIAAVLALLIPPFVDETREFVDDVPAIVEDLRDRTQDVTGARPGEIADRAQEFVEDYLDEPAKLIGPVTSIGLSVAGIVAALVLMLITAYYMAVRPQPLIDAMVRLMPPPHRPRLLHVLGRLRTAWIGWMQGVAVDMFVSGLLLYVGLSLIGLDFAIFFAGLTALLSVVPYYGAVASGIPPVLFALTDSPGKALLVLLVYVLVQQIEANLTIPLVMSRTVRLHPVVIAFGVVVVGQLFGFLGLVVAVPILSLIIVSVEEFWIKPVEERHARAGPAVELPSELGDGDDGGRDHADDDDRLHDDPEAGHGYSIKA